MNEKKRGRKLKNGHRGGGEREVHTEERRGNKRKVGKKKRERKREVNNLRKGPEDSKQRTGGFFWVLKRVPLCKAPFKQDACIYVPTLHDNS